MTLQPQWKSQSTLWLIDQIREHVLGSSDATTDSTKRYAGLGAISSPSDALDARFATLDSRFAAITASLAAITTATEVKSRIKDTPRGSTRERPAVPKYPCRWCQGAHYDRECPTLTNKTKKPQIPPRNGHAGAITDSDHPGFLNYVVVSFDTSRSPPAPQTNKPSLDARFSSLSQPHPAPQAPAAHSGSLSARFASLALAPGRTFPPDSISTDDDKPGYLMGCVPSNYGSISEATRTTSWTEVYNNFFKFFLLALITFVIYSPSRTASCSCVTTTGVRSSEALSPQ